MVKLFFELDKMYFLTSEASSVNYLRRIGDGVYVCLITFKTFINPIFMKFGSWVDNNYSLCCVGKDMR